MNSAQRNHSRFRATAVSGVNGGLNPRISAQRSNPPPPRRAAPVMFFTRAGERIARHIGRIGTGRRRCERGARPNSRDGLRLAHGPPEIRVPHLRGADRPRKTALKTSQTARRAANLLLCRGSFRSRKSPPLTRTSWCVNRPRVNFGIRLTVGAVLQTRGLREVNRRAAPERATRPRTPRAGCCASLSVRSK